MQFEIRSSAMIVTQAIQAKQATGKAQPVYAEKAVI